MAFFEFNDSDAKKNTDLQKATPTSISKFPENPTIISATLSFKDKLLSIFSEELPSQKFDEIFADESHDPENMSLDGIVQILWAQDDETINRIAMQYLQYTTVDDEVKYFLALLANKPTIAWDLARKLESASRWVADEYYWKIKAWKLEAAQEIAHREKSRLEHTSEERYDWAIQAWDYDLASAIAFESLSYLKEQQSIWEKRQEILSLLEK